jgi:hypothetical protein
MVSLCSVILLKTDRMPYFDIRHSVFDIRFLKVSNLDQYGSSDASGWANT